MKRPLTFQVLWSGDLMGATKEEHREFERVKAYLVKCLDDMDNERFVAKLFAVLGTVTLEVEER